MSHGNVAAMSHGNVAAMLHGNVAAMSHGDVAAMSPLRHVYDIALRRRGDIAKCNNLGSHLCRCHVDATFSRIVFQCRFAT